MIDPKAEIIYSYHALQRLKEIGLDQNDASCMLLQSEVTNVGFGRNELKRVKYGDDMQKVVEYYKFENILFTVNQCNKLKFVVITVTKLEE